MGTYTLKTTEVTIASNKVNSDVTFVQLTDLHGSSFGENNVDLIDRVKKVDPDFIIVTGDMYTHRSEKGEDIAVDLLRTLAKEYKVYSVNGEHDNDKAYEARLTEAGVDVLDYEMRNITVGTTRINLYGITNVYYTPTFDLHNAFRLDKSAYNILAAHIANAGAFDDFGVDLSVCGDSHGGQIRIPYYGAIYNQGTFLPETKVGDAAYTKGLYEVGDSKLFISSGLGNYPLPIRFLNRPEIAVIHLTGE